MNEFVMEGYSLPEGVSTQEDVMNLQEQLRSAGANIAVDGVWGADTQAAYDSFGDSLGSSELPSTPSLTVYPNAEFQKIYEQIYNSMGTDDSIRDSIEAALRPQYDRAIADLQEQRLAQNAAIDVDAASRGMGNSTWVTDAKLQRLKALSANIANLEGDYASQLSSAVYSALQDKEDDAYDRALDWFNYEQANKSKGGGGRGGQDNGIYYTLPDGRKVTLQEYLAYYSIVDKGAEDVNPAPTNYNTNKGTGGRPYNVNMTR